MLENEPEPRQRQCLKTTTTTSTAVITEIRQLLNTRIRLHVPIKNEWRTCKHRQLWYETGKDQNVTQTSGRPLTQELGEPELNLIQPLSVMMRNDPSFFCLFPQG